VRDEERESLMRRLPAIALTGYATAEDGQRALEAGFRAHVSKPVEPAELVRVVAALAGRAVTPTPT
jgi:CheY-like chemotaxis protein